MVREKMECWSLKTLSSPQTTTSNCLPLDYLLHEKMEPFVFKERLAVYSFT